MEYSDAPQPQKSGSACGCILLGCLGALLVAAIVTGLVVWGGIRFYQVQVQNYTSPDPIPMPAVQLAEEEREALQARMDAFKTAVDDGKATEPIVLTEQEVNSLLFQGNDMEGHVYVDLEEDEVSAQVSFSTDEIPGAGGRYFNGDITLHVEIEDGAMIVEIEEATVNGQPVPEDFMAELRGQNLTEDAMSDSELEKMFSKIRAVRFEKDRMVLIPALPEEGETDEQELSEESSPNESEDPSPSRIQAEAKAEVGSDAEATLNDIN